MLITAGALLILLALGHSILGERYIVGWLVRQNDLPPVRGGRSVAAGIIRFAWHVTSVLSLTLGAVLVMFNFAASAEDIVAVIGWMLIGCSILPIVFTRLRHPSWVIFIVAGVLCLIWTALPEV